MGRRLAEKIPFTDESPTAHIKVANIKFQFSTVAAFQIMKVIKKLITNKVNIALNNSLLISGEVWQ